MASVKEIRDGWYKQVFEHESQIVSGDLDDTINEEMQLEFLTKISSRKAVVANFKKNAGIELK